MFVQTSRFLSILFLRDTCLFDWVPDAPEAFCLFMSKFQGTCVLSPASVMEVEYHRERKAVCILSITS